MRDRPHPNHRLEWPGGVVPEWARPQQNSNRKRRGKGGGGDRNARGGSGKRERLQKVMAQSGHGSRRNIEILIAQGHITINGQVAKLGDSVGPNDKVKLDGNLITLRFGDPLPRVLLYHKNAGEIVTRDDPEKRPTVFERLPKVHGGRWVSVGRLDFNTEGLLIFTTSGELANRLTHPRYEVEREYAVRTLGELTEEQRSKLLTGVDIDGESCKFDSLEDRGGEGANHWYHVVLREGKNREVRRMMEAVGLTVSRLLRVRFGTVELPGFLKRGMMREMDEDQVQALLSAAGMFDPPEQASRDDEDEEDEFDNIGNRLTEANRDRRNDPEEDFEDDDLGNRVDPRQEAAQPPDADGNRGSYDFSDRPDPHTPGARRAHGKGFHKKRAPGDGDGNRQPRQHHAQGQPQQQQQHGQGHRKHKHRNKGQGQPHGQQAQQGHAQQPGQPGAQAQPGQQGQPGPQQQGQPGQGKGRHRRHRNRNRNRNRGNNGSGPPRNDPQPAEN